jgi:fructoselysine-6-P-deglycase FrlB-like protein
MIRFREETGEQPGIASEMVGRGRASADSIGPRIREAGARRFLIAARGGSDHAALDGKASHAPAR